MKIHDSGFVLLVEWQAWERWFVADDEFW